MEKKNKIENIILTKKIKLVFITMNFKNIEDKTENRFIKI
jgi:hypothetical protein